MGAAMRLQWKELNLDVGTVQIDENKHLVQAGLNETRADLFEAGANRGRFGTHGFRRSFVTIHMAAGYTDTWCMDRTGHDILVQLKRYRQMARTIQELDLGELSPLDTVVPELYESDSGGTIRPRIRPRNACTSGGTGRRTGFRFRRVKP